MIIGIYKIGRKIYFSENAEDHSAISTEVTQIIKIFASRGHEVHIISPTDYTPGSIDNVHTKYDGPLDMIFIWNGVGLDIDILEMLKYRSKDLRFIVTDLSLLPDKSFFKYFKRIFTQSKQFGEYGYIEEHECYGYKKGKWTKDIQIYFGGTERGRTADFIEYVMNPEVKWHGKSETFNIKNYIPYHEHVEMMKRAKYSIIIGDEAYNKIGFITPRYYECIRYNVIGFVDSKYDPDEILISHDNFRKVKNFKEMKEKIELLENNMSLYQKIFNEQRDQITQDKVFGGNIYNTLLS